MVTVREKLAGKRTQNGPSDAQQFLPEPSGVSTSARRADSPDLSVTGHVVVSAYLRKFHDIVNEIERESVASGDALWHTTLQHANGAEALSALGLLLDEFSKTPQVHTPPRTVWIGDCRTVIAPIVAHIQRSNDHATAVTITDSRGVINADTRILLDPRGDLKHTAGGLHYRSPDTFTYVGVSFSGRLSEPSAVTKTGGAPYIAMFWSLDGVTVAAIISVIIGFTWYFYTTWDIHADLYPGGDPITNTFRYLYDLFFVHGI
jgi:hypothetical protein